jgi:uncharacterized damage-inducible protein DinB
MAINDSVLIELERETANTRRILERLSDANWDYKPHPKSMSLGALATHVVELHNWVAGALIKSVYDFKVDHQPVKVADVQELVSLLERGVEGNKAAISGLADEDWQSEWTLKAGDWIIAKMPKAGAYRYIINNHLIHHRGQLTVYLRLLDIPVPGLYGPSADES